MLSLNKNRSHTVGVEIDTGSVAAAEISGSPEHPSLGAFGVGALPNGAVKDGEVVDPSAVGEALGDLFSREKLSKDVRVGIANQHVVLRTVRLPLIDDKKQLETAIRFLAQEQIPMPLDAAVLEHQVIGAKVDEDGKRQLDVAVVAARREMVETTLLALKKGGLSPVGVDLSAFGMIRALADELPLARDPAPGGGEEYAEATLFANLADITNLAIAHGRACLFARVAEFGVRQIAARLAEQRALLQEHAEQWLLHVGLEAPVAEIDGDPEIVAAARSALEDGSLRLADELRLSIDSYRSAEGSMAVGAIALCGWGSAIPGLPARLCELGSEVDAPRPAALSSVAEPAAGRLTVPFGIGLER